ncbi:GlxA family transcriptional regulator [Marinobacterium sedimentorum]|uniref:choline metabolism transcriptional regulator GbdR n=1 Tax=Marinobacterium sedimentorum TaxID=2927804 RepID=UPI0020C6841C|nr:GlxA family transcriptional regulator [Marinobacterium sedimentorum]MCP8689639.1 GlxA family transcriptional regulator [Marinobacterium sedimentorum]
MNDSIPGTRAAAEPKSRNIGFLLLKNFTMISLASAIEPLRMANQLSGKELYNWYTLTEDGEPVRASDGIQITPDGGMTDPFELDTIIVAGGVNITRSYSKRELSWLQSMGRKGRKLGGICTGAYALAEAGLMNGYECSAHWECIASLQEAFPKVNCTNRLFSVDRDRLTGSGGTVPLDMMLNMIKQEHGYQLSAAISEMFICDRIRNETDHQRIPLRHVLGTTQPKLVEVVSLMEANLEEAIELDQLACYVGLSRRQLERLFQKYLQCSPSRYYLKLRLTKARQLLKQTSMSIIEVASACGFVSTPHFSKCYREHIGIPPREERMGMRVGRNAEVLMDPMSRALGTVFGGLGGAVSSTAMTALTEAQSEPSYGSVTLQ